MKTNGLASSATTLPTYSYHDVMTNKEIKKIQLGGWSGRKYKEVRRKIERMIKEEWGL
jgi:hypothetical protein